MGVVEVAVVIGVADGETLDDVGGELFGGSLPLLGGVVLDEGVKEGLADEGDSLLGEVLRFGGGGLGLFGDKGAGFGGSVGGVEELVDGAEVNGERENFAMVGGIDFVDVVCEGGELVGVGPDGFVGGMEEMGAVLVAFDTGLGVESGVAVAADVRAAVNQEDPATQLGGDALGEGETVEAGADDKDVGGLGSWGGFGGLSGFGGGH